MTCMFQAISTIIGRCSNIFGHFFYDYIIKVKREVRGRKSCRGTGPRDHSLGRQGINRSSDPSYFQFFFSFNLFPGSHQNHGPDKTICKKICWPHLVRIPFFLPDQLITGYLSHMLTCYPKQPHGLGRVPTHVRDKSGTLL
jgi:hypothetical protein